VLYALPGAGGRYEVTPDLTSNDHGSLQGDLLKKYRTTLDAIVLAAAGEIQRAAGHSDREKIGEWVDLAVDDRARRRVGSVIRASLGDRDPIGHFEGQRATLTTGTDVALTDHNFSEIKLELETYVEQDPITGLSPREESMIDALKHSNDSESDGTITTAYEEPTARHAPRHPRGSAFFHRHEEEKDIFSDLETLIGHAAAKDVTDYVRDVVIRLDDRVVESSFISLLGRYGVGEKSAREAALVFLGVIRTGRPGPDSKKIISNVSEEAKAHFGTVVSDFALQIDRAAREVDDAFFSDPEQFTRVASRDVSSYLGKKAEMRKMMPTVARLGRNVLQGKITKDVERGIREEFEEEIEHFTARGAIGNLSDIENSLNDRIGPFGIQPNRIRTIAKSMSEFITDKRVAMIEERLKETLPSRVPESADSQLSNMSIGDLVALRNRLMRQGDDSSESGTGA
jgi:hypothetical protein